LKEYKHIKTLGKGAFSIVYLAECVHNNRNVAVKALKKTAISEEVPKQKRMIQSELQILNSLGHVSK